MSKFATQSLPETLEAAIKKLVSVEHFRAGSIVSMPVIYPSGASVLLEVSHQAGRVFISDRGGGHQEAEFLGASRHYLKEAARIAAEAGIQFDSRDMFLAEVPVDLVSGAMAVVASCSAQAAAICAMKDSEAESRNVKGLLFDRLSEIFGPEGFARDVELLGSGSHKWRIDAAIEQPNARVLFDAVSKGSVSVTSTVAKFHDIARLAIIPTRRIAVVTSERDVADWLGVLGAASDAVIEMQAANDAFAKYAKAA